MKSKAILLVCSALTILVSGSFSRVLATPMGGSNRGLEHAIGTADAKKWSVGVYSVNRERDLGSSPYSMKTEKALAYLGYDLSLYGWSRWFTTYVCLGQSRTRFGHGGYSDGRAEFGVGMNFNFLDQLITDPTLFEDELRVRGGWQVTHSDADLPGDPDWEEVFAHLTVSIVNDIEGSKFFLPNSIAIYGGPIYSWIGNSSTFDNEGMFGYTAGLEVYYTESISLEVGVESMDNTDATAGLHLRF